MSRNQDYRRTQNRSRDLENRRTQSRSRDLNSSRTQYHKKSRKQGGFKPGILLIILVVLIAAVAAFLIVRPKEETPEEVKPRLEAPAIASSVTVGSTGDILIHSPIYEAAYTGSGYDFSRDFALVAPYYQAPDIMVANLEVTCAGEEAGYKSYPLFNCPDEIVTTLANSGVDICLTANNHMNDSGKDGLLRTLDVITQNGMEYTGTRKSPEDHYILTKMVNGIKLGFVCYTYDTREITDWNKSLNGLPLYDGAEELVNSFSYSDLEELYSSVQSDLDQMKMLGVEANIFYLHWGDEYQDDPNEDQQEIARRLCEMGVDVIVGGHPHVIERYETITSSNGNKMLCLYSMGNEISNQRADLMDEDGNRGYTEDGMIFNVTFSKFNNGKVKITGLDIIPTWVDLNSDNGKVYSIVALDSEKDPSSWGASSEGAAISSYNRTMGRVGSEYNRFRESIHLAPDPESF